MDGLLAMARAFGGTVKSRLRIHKSVYLLKLLGAEEVRRVPFRYHYYGPYSRELSGSLQQAVAAGFLDETTEGGPFDSPSRYSYELTNSGREWLEGFTSDIESRFGDKIPMLKEASLKTLELAATIAFLEREERRKRSQALQRALELKPNCRDEQQRALRLLEKLEVEAPVNGR